MPSATTACHAAGGTVFQARKAWSIELATLCLEANRVLDALGGARIRAALRIRSARFAFWQTRCRQGTMAKHAGVRAALVILSAQVASRSTPRGWRTAADPVASGHARTGATLVAILANVAYLVVARLVGCGARPESCAATEARLVGHALRTAAVDSRQTPFALYTTPDEQCATQALVDAGIADLTAALGWAGTVLASQAARWRRPVWGRPWRGANAAHALIAAALRII